MRRPLTPLAPNGQRAGGVEYQRQTYGYDALGRGTSSATSFGSSTLATTWSINSSNQVQSVTLPGGRTFTVEGRWSRDGTPTDITRPDGKTLHTELNDYGQVSAVYGAGTFAQKYGYDPTTGDQKTLTTYASGQIDGTGAATTNWSFNDFTGQNTGKTYAGETDSVINTFKDNGLLDQNTSGGNVSTATQNPVGELNSWVTADLSQSVLLRDAKGRVIQTRQTSTLDGTSLTIAPTVAYDANDNLASESVGNVPDTSVQYGYYGTTDASANASPGAPQFMTVVRDGQTLWGQTCTYDSATKRPKTVSTNGGDFTYDYYAGTDLVETLNSVNGTVTTSRTYEPDTGRLASLTQRAGATVLYAATYHYNDNDQRDRADVTYRTADGQTHLVYWKYEYDADNADQLKSALAYSDSARTVPITDRQFTYAFDGIGNRTDKSYAPNAANQYTSNPDADGATMLYDGRGNLTYDGVFTYTYDSADRLTSATPQDLSEHHYKMEAGYDDQGRRVWKKTYAWNATTAAWEMQQYRKFVYDGDNLVAEFKQDGQGYDKLIASYAWGQGIAGSVGGLLSITSYQADGTTPDHTYIPLFDGNGSVVALADASTGNVVVTYEYDPFGNTLSAAGDQAALDANPFGFQTMYTDRETGGQQDGVRYKMGDRFLTRDPSGEAGGVNLYAFVDNDPINNADPTGLAGVSLTAAPQPSDPTHSDPFPAFASHSSPQGLARPATSSLYLQNVRCIACHNPAVMFGNAAFDDLPLNYRTAIEQWQSNDHYFIPTLTPSQAARVGGAFRATSGLIAMFGVEIPIVGPLVAAVGVDNFSTGIQEMLHGLPGHSATEQTLQGLGLSERNARLVNDAVLVVGGIRPGMPTTISTPEQVRNALVLSAPRTAAEAAPGGLIVGNSNGVGGTFIRNAALVPEPVGTFNLACHADATAFYVFDDAGGVANTLSVDEILTRARMVGYSGEDIQLLACQAGRGSDSIAAQLAGRVSGKVIASPDFVWVDRLGNVVTSESGTIDPFLVGVNTNKWLSFRWDAASGKVVISPARFK